MSRLSDAVSANQMKHDLRQDEVVTNFMGGDSYVLNPLMTLRMVAASSILGEPSYYRDGGLHGEEKAYAKRSIIGRETASEVAELINQHNILHGYAFDASESTTEVMTKVIDNALDFDFEGTLALAVELRKDYMMRMNPQVIMVRAALHPKREEFTSKHPRQFDMYNQRVMSRADDALIQMNYYLYLKGSKSSIPSILKRSWARNLSKQSRYSMYKYCNHELGMIDAVRICHAKSPVIAELMSRGRIEVTEDIATWESMKMQGYSWSEIIQNCDMGHMAMLRNIKNVIEHVDSIELLDNYFDKLLAGVKTGKQFPFRYYRAYIELRDSQSKYASMAINVVEKCMSIAIENMPKLKGNVYCLTDNSGSAWESFTSEYGRTVIAEINNISAVIAAMRAEGSGTVIKFGDRYIEFPISKHRGILEQALEITNMRDQDVGGGTEGGIWTFLYHSMQDNLHIDNLFIFSDQQAGHGRLYGLNEDVRTYREFGYGVNGMYINVFKLILDYRKHVNDKVNVFSVQTAGYDNNVLPENAYRITLLAGWTGKETEYAATLNKLWDRFDHHR